MDWIQVGRSDYYFDRFVAAPKFGTSAFDSASVGEGGERKNFGFD